MRGSERRLNELRAVVPEIRPEQANQLVAAGAVLIDVRDPEEIAEGSPRGALRLGRGFLELRIEELAPDQERTLLVLCGSGVRSLFAAESLRQLGYRDVRSVTGGFAGWKRVGLPFERPEVVGSAERLRYARQLVIPEVGESGQRRVENSRILVAGAGGLGSPAALYLAAAGVGTLGIVDRDNVEISNLQRQILHTNERVGMAKTESAKCTLAALNPSVHVVTHDMDLNSSNAEHVVANYDLVVDGTDNFPARYLLNDVCVKLNRPYIYGSVYRFEGQVSVMWPRGTNVRGPCYRCLYPSPPSADLAPSCADAGVLGVLPGIIGTLQAVEALKLVLHAGTPLIGRLLCYDALKAEFREFHVNPDPACMYCRKDAPFPGYVDYERFCQISHAR